MKKLGCFEILGMLVDLIEDNDDILSFQRIVGVELLSSSHN